jgi:resolvase-like protein
MLTTMGGIAEFERGLIRKRCQDGIDRAKAKGTKFVRKAVLYKGKRERIAERYANGETMSELARRTIALLRPSPNRRLYVPQLVERSMYRTDSSYPPGILTTLISIAEK